MLYYTQGHYKFPQNSALKLIWIHVLCFLLLCTYSTICYICGYEHMITLLYGKLTLPSRCALLYKSPWTIFTYSFIHKSFWGLLCDIIMLYFLINKLYNMVHKKHIFGLYFSGQLMGALAFLALYQLSPPFKQITTYLHGPSTAMYAMIIAIFYLKSDMPVNFYFLLIPIKYITLFLIFFSIMQLQSPHAGYYLAHLGGALAGYLYIKNNSHGNHNNHKWTISTTPKGNSQNLSIKITRITKCLNVKIRF